MCLSNSGRSVFELLQSLAQRLQMRACGGVLIDSRLENLLAINIRKRLAGQQRM